MCLSQCLAAQYTSGAAQILPERTCQTISSLSSAGYYMDHGGRRDPSLDYTVAPKEGNMRASQS